MTTADAPLYVNEPFAHAQVFAVAAVVLFFASLFVVIWGGRWKHQKTISQVLLALLVLGPPLWFFGEFFYYFPAYGSMAEGAGFEKLKGAQEVTSKVWAAFVVVIGALYNKKFAAGG